MRKAKFRGSAGVDVLLLIEIRLEHIVVWSVRWTVLEIDVLGGACALAAVDLLGSRGLRHGHQCWNGQWGDIGGFCLFSWALELYIGLAKGCIGTGWRQLACRIGWLNPREGSCGGSPNHSVGWRNFPSMEWAGGISFCAPRDVVLSVNTGSHMLNVV